MTIRTVSDIRSKLSELSRTKEQALRDDETEFQSAKRALGMFDCAQKDAGVGLSWLDQVKAYERDVLLAR